METNTERYDGFEQIFDGVQECPVDTEYTLPMDFTVGAALDTFLTDAHEITVGTDLGYYFSPSAVRGFQTVSYTHLTLPTT